MFALSGFRSLALFATMATVLSVVAVDTAEARRGGSFGSRGTRTEFSVPSTQVSPKATAPVQRTTNEATPTANRAGTPAAPVRPTLFGGFGGALLGGLLFSGLFGMMFGYGFGGFGGMLALLFQLLLVAGIVWFFTRRRQPATANGASASRFEMPRNMTGGSGPSQSRPPRSAASQRAGRRDAIGISDADLGLFQRRLGELQDAFSREDTATLRRIATPEVAGYLSEELQQNAARGVRNEVFDVNLLAGDVAEAWREERTDYATVALRYESRDILRDRSTGALVGGEDRVTEATELWTFRRDNGRDWLISAIQDG